MKTVPPRTKIGLSIAGLLSMAVILYAANPGARFAGDSFYSASSGTASLTVVYGTCNLKFGVIQFTVAVR